MRAVVRLLRGAVLALFFVIAMPANAAAAAANVQAAATVDWSPIWSFLAAIAVAAVVVAVVFSRWRKRWRKHAAGPGHENPDVAKGTNPPGLWTPLNGLDSSWSFSDSWATNVTAASGLVFAVLGSSDFLKAVLGANADNALGVATVSGAVAVALVGAAGVLVLALRSPGHNATTILGLLAGTMVALGAAGGEVWATMLAVDDLMSTLVDLILLIAAALATALLCYYAFTSITGLLIQGTATPPDAPDPFDSPAPEILASAILVASRDGEVTRASVIGVLKRLKVSEKDELSPVRYTVATPPLRARSALP